MKISACNQFAGTVSIADPGLDEGDTMTVLVKASDVLIGK